MPEKKRININDTPKWFRNLYIFAPVIGLIMISTQIDNDFYFIYKTGEYIVNNTFPTTDFLSMHSSMQIIVQQWLSSVIYYYLYKVFGTIGVIGFVYVCYLLFCVVMHKLTKLITDNLFIASAFSAIADLLIATMYEKTRPQAITLFLILLALYLLESFVKRGKTVYLCFLPMVSLLLINLHSAMWAMLFIFAAPYGVAALPIKFGKIQQMPCCSFVKLLVCGIACFAVGFINPYGFDAMKYILTSFGYDEINNLIIEMQSTSLDDAWGKVFFAVLAVMLCLAVFVKNKAFTTRFVLLFLGTTVLALMNSKSIAYFFIGGIPAFSYMLKDAEIMLNIDEGKRNSKEKKKLRLLIILFVAMIAILCATLIMQASNTESGDNQATAEYEALDDIVEILDKEKKEDIVLFAGFNQGQYLEFNGYHPYIDGRAELFLKDNNKEFDYLKEYNDLKNAGIYYKDFLNKYGFNYLVIDRVSVYLMTSVEHDDDYELLYSSKYAKLFRLKDSK